MNLYGRLTFSRNDPILSPLTTMAYTWGNTDVIQSRLVIRRHYGGVL